MYLLVDFILTAGIVIAIIILSLLFRSGKKQLSYSLLICFFALILFSFLSFYAQLHKIKWLYIISAIPEESTTWFLGPFLILYIKSLFLRTKGLVKKHILHFIPFVIYTLFVTLPSWLSYLQETPMPAFFKKLQAYGETPFIIIGNLYILMYVGIAFKMLSKYRHLMKFNYSTNEFLWIRHLLIGITMIISIDFLTEVYVIITNKELTFLAGSDGYITLLGVLVLTAYLGYYGVNQSKILIPEFLLEPEPKTNLTNQPLPDTSTSTPPFSEIEQKNLRDKLESILADEKPYLDEDLTLGKLASLLNVSDKKLSTFLNQYLHITFYDLINKKRVQTVKEKIADNSFSNYTLLGIAFESGFKSKTSFNRIFKRETGLSPSEYKAKVSANK